MIRFENVSKVYDETSSPALDDVSLEIDRGDFVYLVGASGSGKSTFLQLVLREQRATAGRVLVAGKDVALLSSWKVPHLRRQMGSVFQDFRLLPNKTVHENVAFALEVLGKSRSEIQKTVPETLEMVGLAGKERRLPHELSGGEQQRVAIARAFVNRPAIILADEPTGNLDPVTSRGIMSVFERINGTGTTIVMATHDVQLVDEMRRRVIELDAGHIIRDEIGGAYTTTSIPVIKLEEAAADLAPVTIPDEPAGSTGFEAPVEPVEPGEPGEYVEPAFVEPVVEPVVTATPEETPEPVEQPVEQLVVETHDEPVTRRQLREQRAREIAEAERLQAQRAQAEELSVLAASSTSDVTAPEPATEPATEPVTEPATEAVEVVEITADAEADPEADDDTDYDEQDERPRRRGLFRRR